MKDDKLLSDLSSLIQEYRNESNKIRDSIPILPLCNDKNIDKDSYQKGQLSVMVYLADVLGISLVFYDLRKGFQETIKTLVMLKMEQDEMATMHLKV